MAKNIYLCLTGAGVVVFMFYCMRIDFFPTGLTLTDVIFFLMVITSFSLFLFFFLVCWYSMSVVVSYLFINSTLLIFRKKNKKPGDLLYKLKGTSRMARLLKIYDPVPGHFLISLISMLVVYSAVKAGKIEVQSVFLSVFATALFFTLIPYVYFEKKVKKDDKKKHTLSIIAFLLFSFFSLSGIPPLLSDAGMSFIGVRKSNVTVILQGNDLEMARLLTGNPNQTYFKCDALFTGVGTSSLLVINNKRMIASNEHLSLSF
ncbi:hypothetical protein RHD99_11120 [Buttiauxella selenatireducens]|uniref:Uncharacterized protein n=1 Tax=Buttiauxella selenatireducens TaxID=3073902 RepID=A0ABY9SKB0_9ENTR|nr:hypothetical protein [Buttiauxella sp. R73]WMY76432.1 hypothetical protein RHD99_11120 [Buttiauxella sp. R73]